MPFLDGLKENKDCLYIYDISLRIFGINSKKNKYLIVVKDDIIIPNDYTIQKSDIRFTHQICVEDNSTFEIIKIKDGFDLALKNSLFCGLCACLNKKFVIKEYVKLIMSVDPLSLRKQVDTEMNITCESVDDYFGKLAWITFANQIIDNHKIVNFKILKESYDELIEHKSNIEEVFYQLLEPERKFLNIHTDSLLRNEKIKKIIQHGKN